MDDKLSSLTSFFMDIVMANDCYNSENETRECIYKNCTYGTNKSLEHSIFCPKRVAYELLLEREYKLHVFHILGERKHKEGNDYEAFSQNLIEFNEDRVDIMLERDKVFTYQRLHIEDLGEYEGNPLYG